MTAPRMSFVRNVFRGRVVAAGMDLEEPRGGLWATTERDPRSFQEVGRTAARRIPGARLVEFDSDHYLTLRHPERVGELLLEFLTGAAAVAAA